MPSSSCSGESITVTSLNDTGSFTFNADGTYAAMFNISGEEVATVPLSCLAVGGASVTCDEFAMALSGLSFIQPDGGAAPGSASATCTTSGTSCNCNVQLSFSGLSATGDYVVSGTNVTVTPNGGGPTTEEYCVQGSTLHLYEGSPSTMTGMAMPAADLVLIKQ
jgi:hypothetical protein